MFGLEIYCFFITISENHIRPIVGYLHHQYNARVYVFQVEEQASGCFSLAFTVIMLSMFPVEIQ